MNVFELNLIHVLMVIWIFHRQIWVDAISAPGGGSEKRQKRSKIRKNSWQYFGKFFSKMNSEATRGQLRSIFQVNPPRHWPFRHHWQHKGEVFVRPPSRFQAKRRRVWRKPVDCSRWALAVGGAIFDPGSIFDPFMRCQMSQFREIGNCSPLQDHISKLLTLSQ